jgi:hypothetical protein
MVSHSVARIETSLWQVRLTHLAAPGGTVQVSGRSGTPDRCGVVTWSQDGDDELVRVRCRDLDGTDGESRVLTAALL